MDKKDITQDIDFQKLLITMVSAVFFFIGLKWLIPKVTKDVNTTVTIDENALDKVDRNLSRQLAEQLYQAMENMGTDDDTIDMVFGDIVGNIRLAAAVYNDFGQRGYGTFGAPLWGSGTNKSLLGWLKLELSDSRYSQWAGLYSKIGVKV